MLLADTASCMLEAEVAVRTIGAARVRHEIIRHLPLNGD